MMRTFQSRVVAVAVLAVAFVLFSIAWQPALASVPVLPTVTPAVASSTQALLVETPAAVGSISVSGSAQVMVAPDEVVLTLGVETNDLDLATAKQKNDTVVKQLLVLTEKYGIDPKLVQTDYINIEPRYDSVYHKPETFAGYFVRKNVQVRLRDLTMFESFYSDALMQGVTHVHGIEFRTTDLRKYRDQARDLALRAAREKADAMASAYGQTIGQVKTVQENSLSWWGSYYNGWGSTGGSVMTQNVIQNVGPSSSFTEDETIAPGQIAVNASVMVEFELVPFTLH